MQYKLRTCVWEITLACCFSCKHCGSRAGRARDNELTTNECIDVAHQLANLGCRRVSLIGGEVFMRPDWDVIAKALTDSGVRVNIITNGFFFNNDLMDRMRKAGIESVSVSLDGTREIHDQLRQEGSFDRAVLSMDTLLAAGIPVSVITTINAVNVKCLDDMYDLLSGRNIYAWQLQACSPMGNASETGIDHRFDFDYVLDFVVRHLDNKFAIGVADNIGYFTEHEGYLRGNRSGRGSFRGCKAGLAGLGIDSTGNVRGCESMYDERFNEGNIRERSLREIWEDPDAFSYNRNFDPDMLSGKCADCKHGSYCAAGCRSYNYFTTGELYRSAYCAADNQYD